MSSPPVTAHLGRATLRNSGWYLDQLITFLAVGDDTGGRFALLRISGGQGAEPYPHYHTAEDETVYLLAGKITIEAGSEELHISPGDTVTIPRGLAHTVRHATQEVTYLLQYSPAGFERYFHEMSDPAEYLGVPPAPGMPDLARMVATAARYGGVFTESLPWPELPDG